MTDKCGVVVVLCVVNWSNTDFFEAFSHTVVMAG